MQKNVQECACVWSFYSILCVSIDLQYTDLSLDHFKLHTSPVYG